jgi:hypothetical protein
MLLRTLLAAIGGGLLATVVVAMFVFPTIAAAAFYVLLAWLLASLWFVKSPAMNRHVDLFARRGPDGARARSTAVTAAVAVSTLGFCVFCAAHVGRDSVFCTACGRRLPSV